MDYRSVNNAGYSLIQMAAVMGVIGVGILIAMVVIKSQSNILKKAKTKGEGLSIFVNTVKSLKEDLNYATSVVSSGGDIEIEKTMIESDELVVETYTYEMSAAGCSASETGNCLKRIESGTGKERVFPDIDRIEWCYESQTSDCAQFDDFLPPHSSHNGKRVFLKIFPVNNSHDPFDAVMELKNLTDSYEGRDDYLILDG